MGWFDQLLYGLGQASPIGRAIEGMKQDNRTMDAANAYRTAPDLNQFAAIQSPDNIYDPRQLAALQALKAERMGVLQKQDAAPVSHMLDRFAASGLDADPNFTGSEWVKGMATTPALGGTMPEVQYDAIKSGTVPDASNGPIPVSSFAANPVSADLINKAELAAQQKGTMARVFDRTASPLDLASLAMNKESAGGFGTITEGNKRIAEQANTADKLARERAAMDVYNNTPVTVDPKSMESFKAAVRSAGGTSDVTDNLLKQFEAKNDPYKNLDEAALTLRAMNGDVKAQGILDRMQGRKIETAHASREPRSGGSGQSSKGVNSSFKYIDKLENDLSKLETSVDSLEPDRFAGAIASKERQIRQAKERHNKQYPDDPILGEPTMPGGSGRQVQVDPKTRKPVPLEIKAVGGKKYWRIGPNREDWIPAM